MDRQKEIVARFIEILDNHLDDFMSGKIQKMYDLKEIADIACLHPGHLSKVIKNETGHHACWFYEQRILKEAKKLLANPSLPIKSVAHQLDYDVSNFTKFFKRFTGTTPSLFRKIMQNKTIKIGDMIVRKPGYGTMRLTGEDFFGEPRDRDGAIKLLRTAVEMGVNFFDTADFYGPGVTNRLLAEALYPYPDDLIIATKVGALRGADKSWIPYSKPEELRKSIENNLKELKLDKLQLVHFGKAGTEGYEDSFAAMLDMQREGKILHLGLSNASVDQFNIATNMGKIVSVENMYSYTQRVSDPNSAFGFQGGDVLPMCEELNIAFIPFFSLQTSLPTGQSKMQELAGRKGISVAQLNIAWLLHQSPLILPIPGTTSVQHLKENIEAADISLSAEDLTFLG